MEYNFTFPASNFVGIHYNRPLEHGWHEDPKDLSFPLKEINLIRLHDIENGDYCIGWKYLNPNRGVFDWALPDLVVHKCKRAQLEMMYTFVATPQWAALNPEADGSYGKGSAQPPKDLQDFLVFVDAFSQRYANDIKIYELWNEFNLAGFWQGDSTMMELMCHEASIILRKNVPDVKIISPNVTGEPNAIHLLTTLLPKILFDIDIIGFHPYPARTEFAWSESMNMYSILKQLLQSISTEDVNFLNLPIWTTEVGFVNSEAPNLDPYKALILAAAASGIQRCYLYGYDYRKMSVRQWGQELDDFIAMMSGAEIEINEQSLLVERENGDFLVIKSK